MILLVVLNPLMISFIFSSGVCGGFHVHLVVDQDKILTRMMEPAIATYICVVVVMQSFVILVSILETSNEKVAGGVGIELKDN
jgi:hypothetical protein